MEKITTFDRNNLAAIRAEIDEAFKAINEKLGITLTLRGITYDPSGASFTAKMEGKAGSFEDIAIKEAISWAKRYGVDASEPSTLLQRKGARLVQFDARKRSRPWIFEWQGKRYVTDDTGLNLMWPKAADAPVPVEADDLIQP